MLLAALGLWQFYRAQGLLQAGDWQAGAWASCALIPLASFPPPANTVVWGHEDIQASKGSGGVGTRVLNGVGHRAGWANASPFSSLPGGGGPATQVLPPAHRWGTRVRITELSLL